MGADTIQPGTLCIACGYSLAGLSREGVCPECATPCVKSLSPIAIYRSGIVYIRRVYLGAKAAFWAQLVLTVFCFVPLPFLLVSFRFSLVLIPAAYMIPFAIWTGAWFVATPPDPIRVGGERHEAYRRSLRLLIGILGACIVLALATMGDQTLRRTFAIGAFGAGFGVFFLGVAYVRLLSERAGDKEAHRAMLKARNLGSWAFVMFVVGLAALGVASLLHSAGMLGVNQKDSAHKMGEMLCGVGLLMFAVAGGRAAWRFAGMMREVHSRAREIVGEETR